MPEHGESGPGGTGLRRRLLLVSTNYAPEQAGIGPYATQTAEYLAADPRWGEVHVLAGMPHYPAWRTDPAYEGRWRVDEVAGGVTVHRRRHTVPARQTAVRRALYEGSILAHGLAAPPRVGRPDAVLAQLPSLAGGVIAARIARRHRVPYVPVVQDLMGAAAAQSGIRGGDRAARAAAAVEARVLRRATLVGVIHPSFVDRVAAAGVAAERIRLVPNWSHVARPTRPRAGTRARLGWPRGRTVVLHSGNMGLKQGLEVLVEAARRAPDVHVVLMGDGNQRERLRALGAGLPNLELLPPAEESDFPEILAAADVLAVTQRAAVLDMSIPSKLTSYFAAGRPVVASVAELGGTAEEVRRSGAGVLVPPEDPAALLAAIRCLAENPAAADALGARGPEYVDAHLSRESGLARVAALLEEAIGLPVVAGRGVPWRAFPWPFPWGRGRFATAGLRRGDRAPSRREEPGGSVPGPRSAGGETGPVGAGAGLGAAGAGVSSGEVEARAGSSAGTGVGQGAGRELGGAPVEARRGEPGAAQAGSGQVPAEGASGWPGKAGT